VATIALVCAGGLSLGLALGPALLLGAALAPTDPVLASDVQVDHERDRDRLRFSLTAEGGLNDGTAGPVVLLALGLMGLHELGPALSRWWLVDVLWASLGGLGLGWGFGFAFSRAVVWLRREREQALGMESFLTLGLIALTYGVALLLHVFGFLAVFAAGLAMRQVERQDTPRHARAEPSADAQVHPEQASAYMAKAVTPYTLAIALGAFLVARPLAVFLTVPQRAFNSSQRRLAAWFGIRGVGSMYYLAYAVSHGAYGAQIGWVADAVLVTITLSVFLHGSTATPVMRLYRRERR